MKVLDVRNAQEALPRAIDMMFVGGAQCNSRNGPVRVLESPVTTRYRAPRERVIFWPQRDANPFFHFFESLWMLSGRRDVRFPASFAKNLRSYSDDGRTLHGAYGHRWRVCFGRDQLSVIIKRLREDPETRRQVLTMWEPNLDLFGRQEEKKDVPCNTQVYFQRDSRGRLDMMVTCRSNDLVWGAYGANVVHFSYLQEYIANCIGCEMGNYWQVSFNWHIYEDWYLKLHKEGFAEVVDDLLNRKEMPCPYRNGRVEPYAGNLVDLPQLEWDRELDRFLSLDFSYSNKSTIGSSSAFLETVAFPLIRAHRYFQTKEDPARFDRAIEASGFCAASDWGLAAKEWIERRRESAR